MELVDVGDSKSPGSDAVPVRVRPGALEPNPRFGLNRGDARVFCWIRGQFVENSRCILRIFLPILSLSTAFYQFHHVIMAHCLNFLVSDALRIWSCEAVAYALRLMFSSLCPIRLRITAGFTALA